MPRRGLSPWRPSGLDLLVRGVLPRATTARIGMVVFIVLLAGSALLLVLLERATRSQLDAEAQDRVTAIVETTESAWRARGLEAALEILDGELGVPGPVIIHLTAADGNFVLGNMRRWPDGVPADGRFYRVPAMHAEHGDVEPYMVTGRTMPDGHRLLVGRSLEAEVQLERTLTATLAAALPLAFLLALLTSRLIIRIIAVRAAGLADVVGQVTAGQLDARVEVQPGDGGDAFDAMGRAFNIMLARVGSLLDELRAVTDGLAHDLRSPLTRLKARIDRMTQGSVVDAADLAAIAAEADSLLAMLDTSLEISRAEAGIGRDSFTAVDLDAMMRDLADMYEPLAEERGVTMTVAPTSGPVETRAHRQLLGRTLANLIDNALRYGADGGQIMLGTQMTEDGARLWVADHGPGIPAAKRGAALRRFGRLDAARGRQGGRMQGAGLGLSLAMAVARLHGGDLRLLDNKPGLKVVIELPLVPAAE